MSQAPAPAPGTAFESETPKNDPDEKRYSSNDLKTMYKEVKEQIIKDSRRESLASASADELESY